MYMDDIKLFTKNEKQLETLINTVRIFCLDIQMKFGIEKSAMLVKESGKRHLTDGIEIPTQKKKIERSEKMKPTITCGYWKLILSNKCR